ncbi:MAG: HNH endonuclease signature motif containing protein [Corynebacterium sp.]|nr:HNH endonuclease signature motif containing protein [Corynebacterium sp.]
MDAFVALNFFATSGIDVLEAVYAAAKTPQQCRELKHHLQMSGESINKMLSTARRFYTQDSQRGLRNQARQYARQHQLSLEALTTISTALSHLSPNAAMSEAQLLVEVVDWAKGAEIEKIKTHVRARIQQLNEPAVPTRPRQWLRCSKHPDADGMRYLIAKLDDVALASIMGSLHPIASAIRKKHRHITQQQALAEALLTRVTTGGNQKPVLQRQGLILLPADGYKHLGNNMLATTDGAQIPAEKLAEHLLADFGYALLYDENCEPVNLYRTQRLANRKQRLILTADQLLCVDPNCDRPAYTAQAHHVQAWKNGGATNLENLVAACPTHNAQNDDDREKCRNGYYVRDPETGRAAFQPPDGGRLRYNTFPLAEKSGRAWAIKHFQKPDNQ